MQQKIFLSRSFVLIFSALLAFVGTDVHAASATIASGQSVTLTATADGSAPFSYQWYKDGAVLTGASASSVALANFQSANAGNYYAVVANSAGSTTSDTATLAIAVAAAPVITTQPVSQTVTAGASVSFAAAASGSPAPAYQWNFNGAAIAGATAATLSLANVQAANAGTYALVATNSVGSATSAAASLTVNAVAVPPVTVAPVITLQPVSQTVTVGASVTFTTAASGSPTPTYQWFYNGQAASGATNATLTVPNVQTSYAGTLAVVATNSAGSTTSNTVSLIVTAAAVAPMITTQPVSQTVTAGAAVTFSAAASGSPAPAYQWKFNGVTILGATSATLSLTNVQAVNAGSYSFVATNSAGAATSNAASLTVNPAAVAPVITTQPVSQTVTAGATVTFSAAASGSPAPAYQWRFNGVTILGATSATLSLTNVQAVNAGSYSFVATNSAGAVTSNAASLSVNPAAVAPVITMPPVSQIVTAGLAVTFSGAASGSPTPTYQWKFNGVAIAGATGTTLSFASAQTTNTGNYTLVASNSAGSVMSNAASLTVNPAAAAPSFTMQPTSQTVTTGSSVTFSAAASGSPAPTYQWQKNGINILGATATSFTISSASSGDAGTYFVVASNASGSVNSSAASLTVNAALKAMPVITTQPATQVVTSGSSVTFRVSACSSLTIQYQWYKGNSKIRRATGPSYTITDVSATDAGTYCVFVATTAGSVTSAGAALKVNATSAPVVFRADFNADGKSDLIWQSSSTGAGTIGLMNGTSTASTVSLPAIPAGLQLRGTGDFNADGKADLLWQNLATGECRAWLMAGTALSSDVSLGTVPPGWQLRGTGDFNGDGKSDLIWQNTVTGECSVWLMTGTTVSKVVSLGLVPVDLMVTGTGDLNRDGQSDVLWQNVSTGAYGVWLMAGTTVDRAVTLGTIAAEWQMCGAGDLNADRQSDLLWQNLLTGECQVWLMNGTAVSSKVSLGTVSVDWMLRN